MFTTFQRFTLRVTWLALIVLTATQASWAQGKQAILVMRTNTANASACDGNTELNYRVVNDFKINGKDEFRIISALPAGRGSIFDDTDNSKANPETIRIGRDFYEDTKKSKHIVLYQLKWGADGVLYGKMTENGDAFPIIPDNMKPQKGVDMPLTSFYSALVTGEARDGKNKSKFSAPLRDLGKMFFVPEGANPNDILFKYAAEEKSLPVWEAFVRKTSNYRAGEANAGQYAVLMGCARDATAQFEQGDYRALSLAQQRAERAQTTNASEEVTQLLATLKQHKQRVANLREQVFQLISASKWDEAIAAAEPIKIYLKTWPELQTLYDQARTQSHEQHAFSGEQALKSSQLETALRECTAAWERLPDSARARACVCQARTGIALRDAKAARGRKQPKQAQELLEKQLGDSDCGRDEGLAKELEGAKCDYAQQLLSEAKQLVGGSGTPAGAGKGRPAPAAVPGMKLLTAQNKPDFRTAREKLLLGQELCASDGARVLLAAANAALSKYCLGEATKALQRNDFGTAYVYLTTANQYTPDAPAVLEKLSQARDAFETKTRVNVGVVFENKSNYRGYESALQEIAGEIESIATHVGIAQPAMLDRADAARSWRALQSGTTLAAPTAIFSGDLVAANASVTGAARTLRGSYSQSNPRWEDADRVHDAANAELKRCRKETPGNCSGYESQVARLRQYRDSLPRNIDVPFNYQETSYRVTGAMRLTFRYADSITKGVRGAETLTASVNQECLARAGVPENIYNLRNASCDGKIKDEQGYMEEMTLDLKGNARQRAAVLLQDFPLNFYKRAKGALNKQQSVEDYLRFLFLTSNKNSAEAQDAKKFLLAFDAELKTDGELR